MGWDFTRGFTRDDVVREKLAGWPGTRVLKHALVREDSTWVLWTVNETTKNGAVELWIGCSLLESLPGSGWGSKDMDEGMGPYYFSCPLEYLDLVPEPVRRREPGDFAWRAEVRKRKEG